MRKHIGTFIELYIIGITVSCLLGQIGTLKAVWCNVKLRNPAQIQIQIRTARLMTSYLDDVKVARAEDLVVAVVAHGHALVVLLAPRVVAVFPSG